MKSFLIIVAAASFLLVSATAQKMDSKRENRDARDEVTRLESAWTDALKRGDFDALEAALDKDFRLTGGGGISDRAAFINALRRQRARLSSISRDDSDLRLESDTKALSHGRLTLVSTNAHASDTDSATQSSDLRITAEPITPARTATVNMQEVARREAARPRATQSQGVAAPLPGTIDDSSPARTSDAPHADTQAHSPQQYRYTLVYVKREDGWRIASLQLTAVTPRD
ncbi:MAG TPA: nuclear transport factor 2 family protein [Pyrinomonadaceae bacterium]|nr:nuclear transport factor 2 family protein [Pyrinomonadaceae bacterium]